MPSKPPDPEKQRKAREAAREAAAGTPATPALRVKRSLFVNKPRSTVVDDINWATESLVDEEVNPYDAPSLKAVSFLRFAMTDEKTFFQETLRATVKAGLEEMGREQIQRHEEQHSAMCDQKLWDVKHEADEVDDDSDSSIPTAPAEGSGEEPALAEGDCAEGGERPVISDGPVADLPE